MCVAGCHPEPREESPGSEDPGKGRFTRGRAGSSQERSSESLGRRAELRQQREEGKSAAAGVPRRGTHAAGEGARRAGGPPKAQASRAGGSAQSSPSTPGKSSPRPTEMFGRVKNRVWETHTAQPYSSSRDILSITTVAFQSLSLFSINIFSHFASKLIVCLAQRNASNFRPAGCQPDLLPTFLNCALLPRL